MFELFPLAQTHVPLWHRAFDGDISATDEILDGFDSGVDWPAASMWRELAERHPKAKVVLTTRDSPQTWWRSVDETVWKSARLIGDANEFGHLSTRMMERFFADMNDPVGSMAAYERHNYTVREHIEPERLIEMEPGDGWGPLCHGLDLPEPDSEYPLTNTMADFKAMAGWD